MSTEAASLSEVDNIEVFDFFNLPKVAESTPNSDGGQATSLLTQNGGSLGGAGLPDPESDWLRYGTPYS